MAPRKKKALTPEKTSYAFLKILKRLSAPEQAEILSRMNEKSVNDVSSMLYNFIHCDLGMSKPLKKKMRKACWQHEADIRYISDKSRPYKQRQKRLVKQTGGFLGTVVATVVPLIASRKFAL